MKNEQSKHPVPATEQADTPDETPIRTTEDGEAAETLRGPIALDRLIDHCQAALAIADARGDRFLSYMLAMTLQAARHQRPPG